MAGFRAYRLRRAVVLVLGSAATLATVAPVARAAGQPVPLKEQMRLPWRRGTGKEFIRNWLVCGEFPNPTRSGAGGEAADRLGLEIDYLEEHGGEAGIIPAAGMTHSRPDGSKAEWKAQTFSWDIVNFGETFRDRATESVVAYAFASVTRSEAGPAVLGLGSDDGVKVWVNGRLVHRNVSDRPIRADEDLLQVDLAAGDNRVLVKVEQGTGDWGFCLRVMSMAEARRLARDVLVPVILPPQPGQSDRLAVLTNRALPSLDVVRPLVVVQVIAPGGRVVASERVRRGDRAVFDSSPWATGAYGIICRMAAADGREVAAYLPWFKGDALAAAKGLVATAARADLSTPSGMVHAMLADMIRDRLRGDLDAATVDQVRAIHGTLMEFAELRDIEAGGRGGVRSRGMVRLAYRDEVDGSPQFCRAYLPADYDPARRYPMVVNLHGYNPPNPPYVGWWGSSDRHDGTAERYQLITLYPHGRGNSSYRGIGDRDVLRCIELAKERFSVDPDRVYLMGYSMGGAGTWHVGTRHPEIFAALGPYYGGWDYRVSLPEEELCRMTPRQRFQAEAESSFAQAEQLLDLPVWVMHGDSDPTVDVAHSRYAVRMLQRWGYDVRYQEVPGGDHGRLGTEDALYEWFLEHQRDPNPRRVRVRAAHLSDASAYWVRVEQREDPFAFILADVEVTAQNEIRLDTENVMAVTLSPDEPLVDPSRPLRIVWNGAAPLSLELPESGRVVLRATGYEPAGLVKTPEVEGPIAAVKTTPFAVVVGTISPDPLMRRMCQSRADAIARAWESWQHWPPRFFEDTKVSESDLELYSLILVGGPDANAVTGRLMGQLPLAVSPEEIVLDGHAFAARDAALQMIYPRPLNPSRYVVLVAGTSPSGLYFADGLPENVDFCIADGRIPDPEEGRPAEKVFIATGCFDHMWRLDPAFLTVGDPEVRARSPLRQVPTRVSAATDESQLMLSGLLETKAEGTFTGMRRDMNWEGNPIALGGKAFASGICVNTTDGPNAAEFDVSQGGWRRLRGVIGIEALPEDRATKEEREATGVCFVVTGDGKQLYRSAPFIYTSGPANLDVDISGVKTLRLAIELTGAPWDAVASVDWADLRLER